MFPAVLQDLLRNYIMSDSEEQQLRNCKNPQVHVRCGVDLKSWVIQKREVGLVMVWRDCCLLLSVLGKNRQAVKGGCAMTLATMYKATAPPSCISSTQHLPPGGTKNQRFHADVISSAPESL